MCVDKAAPSGAIVCFQSGLSGFTPRATNDGPIQGEPTFQLRVRKFNDKPAGDSTPPPTSSHRQEFWRIPLRGSYHSANLHVAQQTAFDQRLLPISTDH